MTDSTNTIRVVIPLTIRKRNGRPKILPPDEVTLRNGRAQDPHVLRAIARAWSWRRRIERGEASTIADIATWPWYGSMVLYNQYNAAEFLDLQSYKNANYILRFKFHFATKQSAFVHKRAVSYEIALSDPIIP